MSPKSTEARSEWRAHWKMVVAAAAGMSFVSVASTSMGLFIDPLTREFGWTRAETTAGLTVYAVVTVPLSPMVGILIDRWGARRLGVWGMMLAATSFAAIGRADGSFVQWLALWTVYSLIALTIKMTVWTAAVSNTFNAGRGLALAVTLCGSAITQIAAPQAAQWLIDNLGWRQAYLWLGMGWGGTTLVLLTLFFQDSPRARPAGTRRAPSPGPSVSLTGLTPAQALGSAPLTRIALSTFSMSLALAALNVHFVPVLEEAGMPRRTAAAMAALSGLFAVLGKLVTGRMLDKGQGGGFVAVSLALPALACFLLLGAAKNILAVGIGAVLIGYTTGAYVQTAAYLTGRYGGLRHYGAIFGTMGSMIALGLGIGPLLASLVYDRTGSYGPMLVGAIPLITVSSVLILKLGAYPDWNATGARR